MKKKNGQLLWIPLWIDKWIFGSTRIELEPDERSVWVDLMALAAKDLGFIRANETTPYYARQLSGLLNITEELLARTIKKCLEVDKLTMNEKGIIYLTNWDGFQLSERYKRRIKKREKENTITDGNPFWDKVSVLCPKKFRKMASKNNMVRLNRLIAAYFIDRCLKEEEEVHHLDGNENNNYPKNLILFGNHSDHQKFHWNHDINIIWDGRKETEETISALYAELTASDATNRHTREYKEENIKNRIEYNIKHIVGFTPLLKEVIDYLNLKVGTSYRSSTPKTKSLISARLNDGFCLNDFKRVIDVKVAEWKDDPEMSKFLRPETLFGTKFESYLQQKDPEEFNPYPKLPPKQKDDLGIAKSDTIQSITDFAGLKDGE